MKSKILTVDEIIKMSNVEKINMYRQGYALSESLEHSNILKLSMQDCPNNIQQGSKKNIIINLTSIGTPGYIYKLYMKKSSDTTFTEIDKYPNSGKTNNTSHTFSHTFDETVDSYIIKTEVTDSCINGALSNQVTCTINITAEEPILTSLTISPATAMVDIENTKQLVTTCKDQHDESMNCPTLTWTSNDNSIAIVNSTGLVTGIAKGTVTINVSAEGKTSTSKITVGEVIELNTDFIIIPAIIGLGLLYIINKRNR